MYCACLTRTLLISIFLQPDRLILASVAYLFKLLPNKLELLSKFWCVWRLSKLYCFNKRAIKLRCKVLSCVKLNLVVSKRNNVRERSQIHMLKCHEECSYFPLAKVERQLFLKKCSCTYNCDIFCHQDFKNLRHEFLSAQFNPPLSSISDNISFAKNYRFLENLGHLLFKLLHHDPDRLRQGKVWSKKLTLHWSKCACTH